MNPVFTAQSKLYVKRLLVVISLSGKLYVLKSGNHTIF